MDDIFLQLITDHTLVSKQFIALVMLLVVVPLGALLARGYDRAYHVIFFVMIFALVEPNKFGLTFLSHGDYRAAARAVELHMSDFCALALLFATLWRPSQFRFVWMLPAMLPYLLYVALAVVSWLQVPEQVPVPGIRRNLIMTIVPPEMPWFETSIYPLFQLFRLAKGILIMWVTAHAIQERGARRTLVWASAAIVAYLSIVGLQDRYMYGVHRVAGGLLHPNDFAGMAAMGAAIILPFVFQEKRNSVSLLLVFLALGALGCAILSVSRSGLVVVAFAMVSALVYGIRYHWSRRNAIYLGIATLMVCGFGAVAKDQLMTRLWNEPLQNSVDDRYRLNHQGVFMARDHTLGVGMGNYSAYSWTQYAEEVDEDGLLEPGLPAHNIWYLTLGELGWPGLLAFVLFWFRATQVILSTWRFRLPPRQRALLFGVILSLIIVHLESMLHFSYRNPALYAYMHLLLGVGFGLHCLHSKSQKQKSICQNTPSLLQLN